jgi:hypothetical protein
MRVRLVCGHLVLVDARGFQWKAPGSANKRIAAGVQASSPYGPPLPEWNLQPPCAQVLLAQARYSRPGRFVAVWSTPQGADSAGTPNGLPGDA